MPSGTTDLVEDLRRTTLFADAEPARLSTLAARAYVRRFAAGQLVFTEGEPSEHLYVVRRGRVRILVASPHGEELTLAVLGVGDTIGELSVIDGHARSASAECIEPAELVTVAAADVRSTLATDPALLLAAAAELATMVRRLTGGAADMVFLDLPRRLAKLIAAETVTRGTVLRGPTWAWPRQGWPPGWGSPGSR